MTSKHQFEDNCAEPRRSAPSPAAGVASDGQPASASATPAGGAAPFAGSASAAHSEFTLEERLAFLERHVQQQDREIYAQSEQIRRLQMLLQQLNGQVAAVKALAGQAGEADDFPADDRPPHY